MHIVEHVTWPHATEQWLRSTTATLLVDDQGGFYYPIYCGLSQSMRGLPLDQPVYFHMRCEMILQSQPHCHIRQIVGVLWACFIRLRQDADIRKALTSPGWETGQNGPSLLLPVILVLSFKEA